MEAHRVLADPQDYPFEIKCYLETLIMDFSGFLRDTILTSRCFSLRAKTDMHYTYSVQETLTEISH